VTSGTLVLTLVAYALLSVGGLLGGKLVFGHGVRVLGGPPRAER